MPTASSFRLRFYDRDVDVVNGRLMTCNLCRDVIRAFDTKDQQHWVLINQDDDVSHVVTCQEYAWALRRILAENAVARAHVMPEDADVASRATEPEWVRHREAERAAREAERHARMLRDAEEEAYREDRQRRRDALLDEWWERQQTVRGRMTREAFVAGQGGWPPVYHTDVPLRVLFGDERPGDRKLLREIAP